MWIPRLTGLCVVVLTSVGLRLTLVPAAPPATASRAVSLVVNPSPAEVESVCPWGDRSTQKLEGSPHCGDRPWPHSIHPDVITQ